jgi:hypothetical protein
LRLLLRGGALLGRAGGPLTKICEDYTHFSEFEIIMDGIRVREAIWEFLKALD